MQPSGRFVAGLELWNSRYQPRSAGIWALHSFGGTRPLSPDLSQSDIENLSPLGRPSPSTLISIGVSLASFHRAPKLGSAPSPTWAAAGAMRNVSQPQVQSSNRPQGRSNTRQALRTDWPRPAWTVQDRVKPRKSREKAGPRPPPQGPHAAESSRLGVGGDQHKPSPRPVFAAQR